MGEGVQRYVVFLFLKDTCVHNLIINEKMCCDFINGETQHVFVEK